MSYEKSPIDDFFYGLYGYYPTKSGQSYELIVNAALKILNKESTFEYNKYIQGVFSEQNYQLDGIKDGEETIEAKDYTIRDEKVGRPDIQKQEGGLVDLPHKAGIFASATGYTKNAEKYAKGTNSNPMAKKIELYNIRPSTKEDEDGRIKTVILNFCTVALMFEQGKYEPVFEESAQKLLNETFPSGEICVRIDKIYNSDGTVYQTAREWSISLNSKYSLESTDSYFEGEEDFSGKKVLINDVFFDICKMKYKVPIARTEEEFKIEQDGNACLYVRNSDGSVDTLLTDVQMKKVRFEDGQVKTD